MKKLLSLILCILIALSAMPLTVGAVEEDVVYEFTHSPTTKEPYVEVKPAEGVKYQWYEFSPTLSVVDYSNAHRFDEDPSNSSTYAQASGWFPSRYSDDEITMYFYFTIELNAGDLLYLNITPNVHYKFAPDRFALLEYENGSFFAPGGIVSDNELGFIIQETATYVLVYVSEGEPPYLNVQLMDNSTNKILNGKTSSTLSGVEDGTYVCRVTFADGLMVYSDTVDYCNHKLSEADCLGQFCQKCEEYYGTPDTANHVKWTNGTCVCGEKLAITHQPTAQEKYVEVNYPSEATYQWYKYETAITDVTNQNAYSPSNRYNAQYGWGACADADSETRYIYFRINLKKGDVLVVEPTQKMQENAKWFLDLPTGVNGVLKDGKFYFEIQRDGTYYLKSDGETTSQRVKAYVETYVPVAVEGQTSSELTLTDEGTYECKVTFLDSSSIISDSFELQHIHFFRTYISNNDATCTEDGTKTATCSCGEKKTVTDTGSALGHKDSNKDEKCDRCDYEYPHTHSFSAYVSNNDATCTKDGTKTAKCTCGEEKTVADKGSALGHTDEDGDEKCDRCKTDLGQQKTCDHFCHSENSFIRIIYLVHRFFFKLLGVAQVCECGALHY